MKLKRTKCSKCKYSIVVEKNYLGVIDLTNCKLIEEDNKDLITELQNNRLYCNKVEEIK